MVIAILLFLGAVLLAIGLLVNNPVYLSGVGAILMAVAFGLQLFGVGI